MHYYPHTELLKQYFEGLCVTWVMKTERLTATPMRRSGIGKCAEQSVQ